MSWKKCATKPAKGGAKPQRQGSNGCCPTTSWCASLYLVAHSRAGEGHGCGPCNIDNTNDACATFNSGGANQTLPATITLSVNYGIFGICPNTVTFACSTVDTGGTFQVVYDDGSDVKVWACVKSNEVSGLVPPTCVATPPSTLDVGCSTNFALTLGATCP